MKPLRVIIADDHRMVREGLKHLLEIDGDIVIVGEAGNGVECLSLIEELHPDIALVDINMPVMNGLQMLAEIRQRGIIQKIIVLTIHNEVDYLSKSLEFDVDGYVLKDSDAASLRKAIFSVFSGEKYIEPSLFLKYKDSLVHLNRKSANDELSDREVQVLKLLAEGLYNKEIAFQLNISEKTVKNHVSNIFKKIGVSDRTQAAIYAIKYNYVEVD